MNYEQAINFFHSFDRFGVQPGLDRVCALSAFLGNPQKDLSFIHVAGTNGKGSTSTMLSEVFRAAGYTVGLYTSPYVLCFRERMQVNGKMISEDELSSLAATVKNAVVQCNENNIFPTEFEVVTAAAFAYFKQKNCDIVILEVGLGGRFDATNIIEHPECSVITSISFDHVGVLGDTLEKIAGEKAGIIKNGVPVVTSENQPEAVLSVIKDDAQAKNTAVHLAHGSLPVVSETLGGTKVNWDGYELTVPFAGAHMVENACLAIKTLTLCAEKWHISQRHIVDGIAAARIPARLERLCEKPLIILDGSHNDGSTKALAEVLKKNLDGKKILALMGMMADKEVDKALSNLLPCFAHVLTVTPSNPRAITTCELAEKIRTFGASAEAASSIDHAIDTALERLGNFDALVICGSLYLAADVREKFIYHIDKLSKNQ
ncbi:MAG: bifunctional folylpolyglutamate synthase/dihydrofolate synthase [Ruminococcaceae bacterium]|nr:bifunctional folylpolyglutamate synthase/dihydrofolate synthase [Oscillospiraceae bacterium]